MYPHRIRLHGPWQAVPVGWTDPEAETRFRTDDLPPARTLKVPVALAEFGFGDRRGVVDLRRTFGAPRQLDPWERVWLVHGDVIDHETMNLGASWRLNGADVVWSWPDDCDPLTTVYYPLRTNVTALIRERNDLVVRVDTGWPGQRRSRVSFGGAALEVGRAAYIRQIRVEPRRIGHGFGLLADVDVICDDQTAPLELYALIDGRTVAYDKPRRVEPRMSHTFRLDEPVIDPGRTIALRIDIVCGADIWYAAEVNVTTLKRGNQPELNWN